MRAAVIAGSMLEGKLGLEPLESLDVLVAVDGGADALADLGLVPSLLVGDMDSISPEVLAGLEAQGVEAVALSTAKDETDTEAALRLVLERGASEIIVFGALGGPRLDHLVGNLLLLTAPWLDAVRVKLVDGRHEVFLVKGDSVVTGRAGDIVSLLPLTPVVDDVSTEGLLYPLRSEPLVQCQTRGVSNEMMGREARVTHGEGALLLVHYRGG
jgi:thiamine pyrophosphokinase